MASLAPAPVLALLGSGIFARDAYAPILKDLQSVLTVGVVWSRSEAAAKHLQGKLAKFSPGVEAEWGEDGLERILASPRVQCCAIVLPIRVQPKIVLRALCAGKHVLQEKPIAGTLSEGIETLQTSVTQFVGKNPMPIWTVAENFRFEPAFQKAQEMIKELGTMIVAQVVIEVPMNSSNKYFLSEWRRDPSLKGAFITDCGVHFVAGLRTMVGDTNIVSVSSIATQRDPNVPSPDTLTALLSFDNGCSGVMVITYSSSNNKATWRVVCSKGTVQVERGFWEGMLGYTVTLVPLVGKETLQFYPLMGLQEELKTFAMDIQHRQLKGGAVSDWRGSPLEALRDLAVVETCLLSGSHESAPVHMKVPLINQEMWFPVVAV